MLNNKVVCSSIYYMLIFNRNNCGASIFYSWVMVFCTHNVLPTALTINNIVSMCDFVVAKWSLLVFKFCQEVPKFSVCWVNREAPLKIGGVK